MINGLYTILLLIGSNIFMTLAWYGHLKLQQMNISNSWPLWLVIIFSWGIAFFEYSLQVPANKIGFVGNGGPYSLVQLKVIQEVVSLTVFTVIASFMFQGEHLHWNHAAAFLCLVAAVYFVFWKGGHFNVPSTPLNRTRRVRHIAPDGCAMSYPTGAIGRCRAYIAMKVRSEAAPRWLMSRRCTSARWCSAFSRSPMPR